MEIHVRIDFSYKFVDFHFEIVRQKRIDKSPVKVRHKFWAEYGETEKKVSSQFPDRFNLSIFIIRWRSIFT